MGVRHSLWILFGVAILGLPLLARAAPVVRDWGAHPAVLEIGRAPKDLYCVSDIHGDYKRLRQLLVEAKLVGGKAHRTDRVTWRGGKSVLVVIGDVIDRWPRSVKTLRFLRALEKAARAEGGQVVVTMGNHEQEFLADPRGAKHQSFLDELHRVGIAPEAVAAGRDRLGMGAWMRNLPMAVRVGAWFFAHAGETGGKTISGLERAIERGVARRGFSAPVLARPGSLLNARLDRPWWKELPQLGDGAREVVDAMARRLGVKHIVAGHEPGKVVFPDGTVRKPGEPFHHFGRRGAALWLIDSGLSRGAADTGEILHIQPRRHGHARVWRIDQQGQVRREL